MIDIGWERIVMKVYAVLHKLHLMSHEAYFIKTVVNRQPIQYSETKSVWENKYARVHADISDAAITSIATIIRDGLKLNADDVVLDIGVGDGLVDEKLKYDVKNFYGFDFSAVKLKIATKRNPECTYWRQSFFDKIRPIEGLTKVFSFGVMQYCKPEDVRMFIQRQIELCPLGGILIVHFDVPDHDRAENWLRNFDKQLVEKYKKSLRVIFDDGSYWHDMENVKDVCTELGCGVEIVPAKSNYRSNIYIRVKNGG